MGAGTWNALYYAVFWAIYLPMVTAVILGFRHLRDSRWARVLVGNIGVLVTLLGFIFLVGEGYCLFIYDTTDTFGFVRVSHRWMSRHVQRNTLGFRDDVDPTLDTDPNEFRVGVIGDSFTFGQGVKDPRDRYTDLLEERLARKLSRPVVVYNLSQLGWDTDYHVKVSRQLVPLLHLDMAILAYNMNDIRNLTSQAQHLHRLVRRRPKWTITVGRYSLFLDFIFARMLVLGGTGQNEYQFLADAYANAATWQVQTQRIQTVIDTMRDNGVPLRAVIFPMLGEAWSSYSLAEAHKQVQVLFSETGVETLDLLLTYSRHQPSALWVNRFDTHPNETAHALAAQQIYREWFAGKNPPSRREPAIQK